MSRLRGFVAAGRQILNNKRPALLAQYGRYACLVAGTAVLVGALASVNGGTVGESGIPVPPHKPDSLALTLIAPSAGNADLEVGPYASSFAGAQMDIYRAIFREQAAGAMDEADLLIARLKDRSLMGHVLAQRYLHPAYRVGFDELRAWMERYTDLPQAARIERLARSRMPKDFNGKLKSASYKAAPIEELALTGRSVRVYDPKIKRSNAQNNEAKAMIQVIHRRIQAGEPTNALRTLAEHKAAAYLDDVEKDRLRAAIAMGYFHAGNNERALELSGAALAASRGHAPMAGWVNGLSLWREGQYKRAAAAFESTAISPYASVAMNTSAAFWAARGYEEGGNRRKMHAMLEKAAENPRNFYGLLALQRLKRTPSLNWEAPRLTKADEEAILSAPAGMRAEKLIAAGEVALAEAEIKALYITGDHDQKRSLLAYAYDRRLPSLTFRLGHAVSGVERGADYDAALYPTMPWMPERGYRIDRALIHAIIRQESRFNASAENGGSGATGLMQLIPSTAGYMAKSDIFKDRQNRHLLKNPEVSLDIGQKYVEYLLNNSQVGQDLLSLAMAYNAGPGNLARWKAERSDISDPLLFIESIPYVETRNYVQRVMANYWIYRIRFNQSDESLHTLAQGQWARYASLDRDTVRFAQAK